MSTLAAPALALAAPAAADVIPRRNRAVGPALAGDVVVGGEEARTGAVRVVAGAPSRAPSLIHPIAPRAEQPLVQERRLAHFPERRRRIGDLDLDGGRATWADRPMRRGYDPPPRGPGRIVLRAL